MSLLSSLRSFVSALFRRSQVDADMDEELRAHIESRAEDLQRSGVTRREAERRARIEFGGYQRFKEECREAMGTHFVEILLQDVRFGLRMLRKSPGFTAVAVLTLALGIGANTAIFSVINAVLLKPLPFRDPGKLVALRETESAPGDYPLDGADYLDWQAQNKTFESMTLFSYPMAQSFSASEQDTPESVSTHRTQANFFETLGIAPLAGRTFSTGEDVAGKNHLVVLSYGFWQRHFGGSDAVGVTVQLNSEPYTVIGIMPPWFNFPAATDLWVPFDMNAPLIHNRGSHWANAVGRVKQGVNIEQARADLLSISEQINKAYRTPDDSAIHSLVFPLKEQLVGYSRPQLLILLGSVALVLLVACANIANLLLARSAGRQREMAVRAVLGAGRWRLAHQLLTESILLSLGGAALGFFAAWWGVSLLRSSQPLPVPQVTPIQVDLTVLLFTVAVSLLVGILFGVAPALQSSRLDLSEELKSTATAVVGATGSGRTLRSTLIVAEIAVSLALLVGAGLLLRSFARLRSADIGVQPENVLTTVIQLPKVKYKTVDAQRQFFDELLPRVNGIPGVVAAAISDQIALEGGRNGYVSVPGNTNPALANQLVEVNYITPDYFRVFGLRLVEGRNFTQQEIERTAEFAKKVNDLYSSAKNPRDVKVPPDFTFVTIINQTMAKTFWPSQDPIGKTYTSEGGGPQRIVIGVVSDEKQHGLSSAAWPEHYYPLEMTLDDGGAIVRINVKTAVPPATVLNAIRGRVHDLDGNLALFHARTMDEVIAENMQDTTVQAFLLGIFAVLAMVLAAVGLYGVVSYLVKQRTHEIGIRTALGAQPQDLLKLVIGYGSKLIFAGITIGIAAALALTHLLSALLFGVSATDPLTFLGVSLLLGVVALLACYIPARRATRIDPLVALRYE